VMLISIISIYSMVITAVAMADAGSSSSGTASTEEPMSVLPAAMATRPGARSSMAVPIIKPSLGYFRQ
jgi:hypothetical protein